MYMHTNIYIYKYIYIRTYEHHVSGKETNTIPPKTHAI